MKLFLRGQVCKRVWILEARSKNGSEKNDIFWSEIGSALGELGGTPPPIIPGVPPNSYSILFP